MRRRTEEDTAGHDGKRRGTSVHIPAPASLTWKPQPKFVPAVRVDGALPVRSVPGARGGGVHQSSTALFWLSLVICHASNTGIFPKGSRDGMSLCTQTTQCSAGRRVGVEYMALPEHMSSDTLLLSVCRLWVVTMALTR